MSRSVQLEQNLLIGAAPPARLQLRQIQELAMRRFIAAGSFVLFVALLMLLLASSAAAQEGSKTSDQTKTSDQPTEGINSGNYNFQQTAELGYRWTSFTGNQAVFDTFLNLHDGMRLLDYSLNIRSLNHNGALFDNLYFTNFGYGGDPNNASFLRIYKNKWYSFSGQFRRDLNFWDYDLLANPLNPPNAFINNLNSPHSFHTARRMSDLNLILMPQSQVRVRLGYNRNISDGPALSSLHEGTEALLFEDWMTTVNTYQIGVDVRVLPKTNISYDQFFNYYKGDTSFLDQPLSPNTFYLSPFPIQTAQPGSPPADAGLVFNPASNSPCAGAFSGNPPALKALCNGYTINPVQFAAGSSVTIPGLSRAGRVRSRFPTEQLSFQSTYFKNLDMSGRVIYSGADTLLPDYQEFFSGLLTRTAERAVSTSGMAKAQQVSTTVDFAATYRLSDKLRLVDTFRFRNANIPGAYLFTGISLFSTTSPASLLSPVSVTPQGCLTIACAHSSSSPADITNGLFSRFFKQNIKMNTFEVEYDFTRRIGARAGFRFRDRTIDQINATPSGNFLETIIKETFFPGTANRGDCALVMGNLPPGCTQIGTSGVFQFTTPTPLARFVDEVPIKEYSGLFGLWVRPTDKLRASADVEFTSADNVFTRVSPRNLQRYKFRATYEPREWVYLATAISILENRNNVFQVNNLQHDRSYSFDASFFNSERFALDLAYEYIDVFSHTDVCFAISPLPPGPKPPACPTTAGGNPIFGFSKYDSWTHYGYFNMMWKPIKRITTGLGYTVSSVNGRATFINPNTGGPLGNPNSSPGSLAFNYHQPYADLILDLAKGFSYRTHWGYYGYNEREPSDLATGSRKFRGNLATFGVRYKF